MEYSLKGSIPETTLKFLILWAGEYETVVSGLDLFSYIRLFDSCYNLNVNLAFLLHIYQPYNQQEKVVKNIAVNSYIPLIKTIVSSKSLKLTLNIPLSLSYELDRFGYSGLVKDIKDLYEQERIELTSTAAYHCLLPKTTKTVMENQILLNEYGLGYYYGKHKGFEGEDAVMVKNVTGFFPPELASNQQLLETLDSMGYKWMLVDEAAFYDTNKYNPVYNVKDLDTKVICRNTKLSNLLSFKRDTNIDDFVDEVLELRAKDLDAVVALDGEFFGHHYSEGIFLLEQIVARLISLDINLVTISELVEHSEEVSIEKIVESSWGATKGQVSKGNIYPLWKNDENEYNSFLWDIFSKILEKDSIFNNSKIMNLEMETFPIWNLEKLEKIEDKDLKNKIKTQIIYLQSLNSDQFWWSSNATVFDTNLSDQDYINKAVKEYKLLAELLGDTDLVSYIDTEFNKLVKD